MATIGRLNTLRIVKEVDFGLYLDGGEDGEILLPKRYVPEDAKVDEEIEVFIYFDSEDRIIATTETPKAMVGDFAYLKVISVNKFGAFMDWGLPKDLFVPFREQEQRMEQYESYVVFVYSDPETNRIVASSKLSFFLDNMPVDFEEGEEVRTLIFDESELGYKAIVQDAYSGIFYQNEVFEPLRIGEKRIAYVKKVREDDKIDLMLNQPGYAKIDDFSKQVLDYIQQEGGKINMTDKSPAEEIYAKLHMSKKNFKKAVGRLYKEKMIVLEEDGIRSNS